MPLDLNGFEALMKILTNLCNMNPQEFHCQHLSPLVCCVPVVDSDNGHLA